MQSTRLSLLERRTGSPLVSVGVTWGVGLLSAPRALEVAELAAGSTQSMNLRSIVHPARDLLAGVLDMGRRYRRSWVGNGRAHIDVRGIHRPEAQPWLGEIESRLEQLRGVDWAEVNAVTGRVVVAFDQDAVDVGDLVDVVESVEEAHDVQGERFPADRPDHPGDRGPLHRNLVAFGADVVGLGLSGVGQLVPFAPLPVEAAAVVSAIDADPRLRRFVDHQMGPVGDLSLAILNAAAQGLSAGPLGLIVDLGHRAGLVSEITARNRTWDRREPELSGHGTVAADAHDKRPVPVPAGPIERYADLSSLAAVGAFGVGWAVLQDPRRAANLLIAGLPKAARLGREAFAAQLGRTLANRGAVVMDAAALRRLDRVDTVVLDAAAITSGATVLGGAVALADRPRAQIRRHAQLLFAPAALDMVQRRGDWSLGPLSELGVPVPNAAKEAIDGLRSGSQAVLGLAHGRRLVGAVAVVAELDELAQELVGAAREGGMTVVVAGARGAVGNQLGADHSVAGGHRLAASIRSLQAEGHVVALVGRGPTGALRAADCGIGVLASGRRPPWGADLIIGPGLGAAVIVLAACRPARQVSWLGVQLAAGGSVMGGTLALLAPPFTASRRAILPVNGAALASLAGGAWKGLSVARRPTPVASSPVAWHALAPEEVLERLGTTRHGLTRQQAARRRRDPAADLDPSASRSSYVRAVVEELANPLTPLLGAGAVFSAAVGSVVDAVLVGGVTGLNAMLGAAQRVGTERSLERLVEASSAQVTVTRDGKQREVPVDEVVVGDIVLLAAGEVVPADARILEADALEVDESALTGESVPVAKSVEPCIAAAVSDQHCMIFDDTTVAAGTVTAVAVAVGRGTEAGRALAGGGEPPPSGVETRLAGLTRVTVPVTLASGALTTTLGVMRGRSLRTSVQSGVSLSVAAVPEGLPLLATVAQSASARRLSVHNALVRNPRTIEALGRVDLLCFDKTGTLTEGRLALQRVSDGTADQGVDELDGRHQLVLAAGLRATPTPDDGDALPHATDRAIAEGARRASASRSFGAEGWTELDQLPFESGRSFHAVIGRGADGTRGLGEGRSRDPGAQVSELGQPHRAGDPRRRPPEEDGRRGGSPRPPGFSCPRGG